MAGIGDIVGAGLNLVGGLVSANQARQDKKGALGKAQEATKFATDQYGSKAGVRARSLAELTNPDQVSYTADYQGTPQFEALPQGAVPTYQGVGVGGPDYTALNDPLLTQANTAVGKSLASISDSPDRLAMAKQALADFDAESAPQLGVTLQQIGQKAAALGRIGNKGVNTELSGAGFNFEKTREAQKNALIRDALDATQKDKQDALAAASGVSGQRFGQATQERGYKDTLAADTFKRAQQERDQRYQVAKDNLATTQSERATKNALAQQGVQNKAQQRQAENTEKTAQVNRGLSLADLGFGGINPASGLLNEANIYSGSAADAGAAAGQFMANAGKLGAQAFAKPATAIPQGMSLQSLLNGGQAAYG